MNAAMNITFWDRSHYRKTQWTWPITSWCLPDERIFGSAPLVVLGSGAGAMHFSAQNLTLLFKVARAPALEEIFPTVANLTQPALGPGVEVFCMCGTGLKTPVHYAFPSGNLSEPPKVINYFPVLPKVSLLISCCSCLCVHYYGTVVFFFCLVFCFSVC